MSELTEAPFDDNDHEMRGHHIPPSGWYPFGTHAAWDSDDIPTVIFSEEKGEDLLPLWERRLTEREIRLKALRDAQQMLAGEDSVDWARRATNSTLSLPYAIDAVEALIQALGNEDASDED